MPKVQTTSAKNGENRGVVGEVVCVLGAVVFVVVAVLAAGPLCWRHEPFNAQLNPIGGMVGSLPRPPPIGLTCASMGPHAGHRANMRVTVLTCAGYVHRNTRGPEGFAGLPTLSICPGRRRRRNPEGSRPSLRTVATPSVPKSHPTNNT